MTDKERVGKEERKTDSKTYTKASFYIDDIVAIKIVSNIEKKVFNFLKLSFQNSF